MPYPGKNIEPSTGLYRVLKPPTTLMLAANQVSELAGIVGRRRPTIPYQAFNLTQTTKLNPTTG